MSTLSAAPARRARASVVARRLPGRALAALLTLAAAAGTAGAQQDERPAVEMSGIVFANYQYAVGALADVGPNQFVLDRTYLTARARAGDRASVRLTADLFRNGSEGYDLRVKYGYLQYQLLQNPAMPLFVRAGVLQTVVIEHEENFWPRWLSPVAVDRHRFFSSADVGVSAGLGLPNRLGELYATITNGRGYQNAGNDDRFKDFALRLTLTPLAGNASAGMLRTLALSPWYYKGDTASAFGPGRSPADTPDDYLGVVHSGRQRDRYGLFVGIRDPRLTLGGSIAEFRREAETGQNTAASPIVLSTQTGRVLSAFALVRPLQLVDSAATLPLGIVLRWDRFEPVKEQPGRVNVAIAGLTYDVNSHVSVALDYQESLTEDLPAALYRPTQHYFAHLVARF